MQTPDPTTENSQQTGKTLASSNAHEEPGNCVIIPAMMNTVCYEQARVFGVRSIPVPEISDTEILLKGKIYLVVFIPGHEVVGTVAKIGKHVTGFSIGDRCVADPIVSVRCWELTLYTTDHIYHPTFSAVHVFNVIGEKHTYAILAQSVKNVYKITTLTDEQAALVEPMSCVLHGIDMLKCTAGVEVLVLGAGPAGLLFCQLLKLNGAIKVVLASNKGRKMEVSKQIDAADEYVEFDRDQPGSQWTDLKERYPDGFDIVIEATGSEEVLNKAIYHVRKGGTLLMYSLYTLDCTIKWPALYVFAMEIQVSSAVVDMRRVLKYLSGQIATVTAQSRCFSRTIAYLESGKIRTEGIVTDVYTIHQYQEAIDKLKSRDSCKVIVKPS
ncbi:hypothetical protein Clacol_010177 [Clathrus columnatus]|uniref:Uncharacterized protein n=1 Tax=Clathrus columnatus TaxID=1419009 RepID=A0AAV5AMR1_9AGAM|nr:hypothetical protein Clacol_010177 [Clathrus columnatus]